MPSDIRLSIEGGMKEPDHNSASYFEAIVEAFDGMVYVWPGNVRELQKVLHTFMTLGKLDLMGRISVAAEEDDLDSEGLDPAEGGLRQRMAAVEKKMILRALERSHWHRGKAAGLLQLNYKNLQRKMKALGIR